MDTKAQLGLRIKAYRKQANLSQAELAEKIGKSDDALSNIERGKSLPSFEMIELLSKALNIPLRDFFDFDVRPSSSRHAQLMEELTAIGRVLSVDDLELAVTQLKAIRDRKR